MPSSISGLSVAKRLGLGFALLCGLVNLLWLEARWATDEDLKEP